jgi:hypothetical protein
MIRRIYQSLPGPSPVRILAMTLIALVLLAILVVFYEWLGTTLLDSGGTIR